MISLKKCGVYLCCEKYSYSPSTRSWWRLFLNGTKKWLVRDFEKSGIFPKLAIKTSHTLPVIPYDTPEQPGGRCHPRHDTRSCLERISMFEATVNSCSRHLLVERKTLPTELVIPPVRGHRTTIQAQTGSRLPATGLAVQRNDHQPSGCRCPMQRRCRTENSHRTENTDASRR